jgi:pimeloyl-ACP methyl ester carboxylesterase
MLHAPVGAHLDRRLFPKLMKPRWVRRAGQRALSSPLLRPLWKRLLFRYDVPADYLARFFGEYRRCESFGQMFDLITPEWFAGLRPVATPATLLWGAEERVLRAGQHQEFLRLLPGAEVVVVRGWDHFPMIEQPAEYTRVVLEQARSLLRRREPVVC